MTVTNLLCVIVVELGAVIYYLHGVKEEIFESRKDRLR